MVGITTLITKGVVEVEFGLAGIIQRQKIRQGCLHNHRFQSPSVQKPQKILWLNECVNDPSNVQSAGLS